MDKTEFTEKICQKREKCSESSALTHFLTISRVFRIAHDKDRKYKIEKIPKTSTWITSSLIKKIKKLELVPQRNLITSIVVYLDLTGAKKKLQKEFSERMYEIVKEIRKNAKPYERSQKQKQNWITKSEIDDFWEERHSIANKLLRKKNLSEKEKQEVQKSLIVALHFGKGLPPGRLDWATATWSKTENGQNEDTLVFQKKNRWYVSVFGKTKRTFGKSVLPIHKPLSVLLKRWFTKTGVIGNRVFFTTQSKPFTHSTYGNYLKRIFQRKFSKNIGASLLRSMYVSNKYKNLPTLLAEFQRTARQMLHSPGESQKTYLKIT